MFHKLVCLPLLAFINIMHCVSPPFNGDSTGTITTKHAVKHSQNLLEIYNNQHKVYSVPGSTQVYELPMRSKRGIVLIDEDFDVTPDLRVVEDKGPFDKKVDSIFKTTPRVYSISEESGSSETMSNDLILTKSFRTPRNVQMTKVLDHKTTTVAFGKSSVKKSTRFAEQDNFHERPRLLGQEWTTGADEDIDASGDGESSIVTNSSRTTIDENTSSKYTTPSTDDPDETTSSRYTTDEDTSSHVVDVTETSKKEVPDVQEDLCLNITCDSKDLLIVPNLTKAVPEGTNLTISCILPNATEQGLLKWYKFNSSDLLLLEENNVFTPLKNNPMNSGGKSVIFISGRGAGVLVNLD
ncbi:hypothetical protein JTE90_001572 [Oedothorax gibbosus]|uniref:Ig-like domain-containing protein n=1 Tax=Oedothorax gibbosus TaxID=931172 RepID=A0AAV6VP87_9ARAC|nr:hypothetical protein JTE90_001572 [Oedothorax gibbosus]